MDAYLIIKHIANKKNEVERMDSNTQSSINSVLNLGTILSIVIGAYASFLSYSCNTHKNVPEVHKIFFAVLAYIFGLFYLIYYYLFRYDGCELHN